MRLEIETSPTEQIITGSPDSLRRICHHLLDAAETGTSVVNVYDGDRVVYRLVLVCDSGVDLRRG